MKYFIFIFFVSISSMAQDDIPIELDSSLLVDESTLVDGLPKPKSSKMNTRLPVIYNSLTTSERYNYQKSIKVESSAVRK